MRQTRIARNIWLGIENLLLHKLRSFLTMLGVVFGVGSVVAMLSVGEGASKEALEQIKKLGSNNIIISSMKSAEEEATSTQHSHMSIYGLTWSLSIGIGPLLGGLLSDNFGSPATWYGGFMIGLTSTAIFFLIEQIYYKKTESISIAEL